MCASNVMVVEDDEDIRWALVELLSMQGYAVATARHDRVRW
jgi:DNA-binding NtrC family response regulator